MNRLVCPGCGGKKSKRAELCRTCRTSANAVGASVLTHVAGADRPAQLRTSRQNTAYHGKCADLARRDHVTLITVKRLALAQASHMFEREIGSSTELSEIEMELVLDWLDEQLEPIPAESA